MNKRPVKSQSLRLEFDPHKTMFHAVSELLALARKNDIEELVAKHLVGALLARRFPLLEIGTACFGEKARGAHRKRDYLVGSTAFIANSLELHAEFSPDRLRAVLAGLIEEYNQRISIESEAMQLRLKHLARRRK